MANNLSFYNISANFDRKSRHAMVRASPFIRVLVFKENHLWLENVRVLVYLARVHPVAAFMTEICD
ncbi:hypothetical protein Tcan_01889 [Toxocara canis]|uniref:Uncharacterized protein n=1 Tax=Toxocara canis TaxID=6265 RepID=A0A0B2VD10_TOXCA|nr:hypothetical protein Tcan_01889 [Toxocara canis]